MTAVRAYSPVMVPGLSRLRHNQALSLKIQGTVCMNHCWPDKTYNTYLCVHGMLIHRRKSSALCVLKGRLQEMQLLKPL